MRFFKSSVGSSRPSQRVTWRAAPSEEGEREEGIELMMQRTPHSGGSPKIPAAYSVVDVAPSEGGYETDATAFSEGTFSDGDDDDQDPEADETGGLLPRHNGVHRPCFPHSKVPRHGLVDHMIHAQWPSFDWLQQATLVLEQLYSCCTIRGGFQESVGTAWMTGMPQGTCALCCRREGERQGSWRGGGAAGCARSAAESSGIA